MKRVTKAMKAALIAAGLMTSFAALSANYPNRPVKFVVPWYRAIWKTFLPV